MSITKNIIFSVLFGLIFGLTFWSFSTSNVGFDSYMELLIYIPLSIMILFIFRIVSDYFVKRKIQKINKNNKNIKKKITFNVEDGIFYEEEIKINDIQFEKTYLQMLLELPIVGGYLTSAISLIPLLLFFFSPYFHEISVPIKFMIGSVLSFIWLLLLQRYGQVIVCFSILIVNIPVVVILVITFIYGFITAIKG